MESRPSILVVDDDQDLVNLLKRILEKEGYRVTTAFDGDSALAILQKHRPNLIILDIMMPGIDGLEVLAHVRQRYDIPVIMLTAKREPTYAHDAFGAGADDYVTKPFSAAILLARVKAKLRRAGPGVDD